MSEQQSQKRGIASEGQKVERARQGYAPIPPSKPVAGAFGEEASTAAGDEDHALMGEQQRRREDQDDQDG